MNQTPLRPGDRHVLPSDNADHLERVKSRLRLNYEQTLSTDLPPDLANLLAALDRAP